MIVVLGLINMGKIYLVIKCMLGYCIGVIGLFLCFLVCEVYDKIVVVWGLFVVVLVIGEECILLLCV